jgi:hypothetical protein
MSFALPEMATCCAAVQAVRPVTTMMLNTAKIPARTSTVDILLRPELSWDRVSSVKFVGVSSPLRPPATSPMG